MPSLDDRLQHAFDEAARVPATDDVMDLVATKRRRRRNARRVEIAGAIVAAIAFAVAIPATLARRDDHRRVATIPMASTPTVQVYDGLFEPGGTPTATLHSTVVDVHTTGEAVREPLGLLGGHWWVTTSNGRATPSHLRPLERAAADEPIATNGEPLSFTEGEGARWIVTRDYEVNGPTDTVYRLKRAAAAKVTSIPIPVADSPTGPVVAGAGAVWIPHRDGVLRFDPTTGRVLAGVKLAPAATRFVAIVGTRVFVTDGSAVRSLDPETNEGGPARDLLEPGAAVTGLVAAGDSVWALAEARAGGGLVVFVIDPTSGEPTPRLKLPSTLRNAALHAAGDRVWLTGVASSGATAVRLDTSLGSDTTVVVTAADHRTLTWAANDRLLFVANGVLFEAKLGK